MSTSGVMAAKVSIEHEHELNETNEYQLRAVQ